MKKIHDQFTKAVGDSRALSSEQQEELLAEPVLFEKFRKNITRILQIFDRHSRAREAYLQQKLDESLTAFSEKLNEEGVDEHTKSRLLEKARQMNAQFFPV